MKKILLILFFPSILFSQQAYSDFFKAVINDSKNIEDYIDPEDLARSGRLGITYDGVKNTFLISFDIDESIKKEIKELKSEYSYIVPSGESNYKAIEFSMRNSKYKKKFYFRDGKFIAPSTYFTKDWLTKTSKYFVFKISEPKYFNDYCINKLDDFVDTMADSLGFTGGERALLKKEKLYYIFCKDEDEVQKITGYKSKGQSVLAFDEVITAYQTHFHEVAHLLMNYKLKKLGLYTHPFLMEGFAVAMGGRGGMAPRVVTDLGYYLQKSAFLTYDSILSNTNFMNQDANMTYAVSGLYNEFLLHELGVMKYFELYRKHNGGIEFVKNDVIEKNQFPSEERFNKFLSGYNDSFLLAVDERDTTKPDVFAQGMGGYIVGSGSKMKFFVYKNLLFGPTDEYLEFGNGVYQSRRYLSIFPDSKRFSGIKYCIDADSISIEIINFYNDEVVYSYNRNLSAQNITIPRINEGNMLKGHFVFFLNESLFGDEFKKGMVLQGYGR